MSEPALDPAIFAEMRELMDDALSEFIQTYLENTPKLILQMEQAQTEADNMALAASAHQLKGGSGSIGAMQLYELARQLEHAGRDNHMEGTGELLNALKSEFDRVEAELQAYI